MIIRDLWRRVAYAGKESRFSDAWKAQKAQKARKAEAAVSTVKEKKHREDGIISSGEQERMEKYPAIVDPAWFVE